MSNLTVLLPCAGRSRRYPNLRPKWMLVTPEGDLMLERAFASVASQKPERVVVGLLREHEERYGASDGIKRALGDTVDVVFMEEDTRGPADTVYRMIQAAGVEGRILVRDADKVLREDELAKLRVPTRFVFGDGDVLGGREIADNAARHIAGATVESMVGGHFLSLDQPDEFARLVSVALAEA